MSGMNGWLDPKWVFKIEPREGYGLNMVGMRVEHYDALAAQLAEAERLLLEMYNQYPWGCDAVCHGEVVAYFKARGIRTEFDEEAADSAAEVQK